MQEIEQYLRNGLKNGYKQNHVLHTSYLENETSIVEYLLTINVAQELIEWNARNNYQYSLYLECPTKNFFYNAFLPSMNVGNNIMDRKMIAPAITKEIKENKDIRTGKIDLVVCEENIAFGNFKSSIIGIEIKGINPRLDNVIKDINRLLIAIEMKDSKFENSIKSGFCLFIKVLGGDKKISTKEDHEKKLKKSIKNIENEIQKKIKTIAKIEVYSEIIKMKTKEQYSEQDNNEDFSGDELGESTKVVFSIIIKITL